MEQRVWLQSIESSIDSHKGLHLTIVHPPPTHQFESYLNQLEARKQYRSIWVELTTEHLPILDICTNKLNFKIHQGLGKKIIIYKWLSPYSDLVTPYSMFIIAAGALVIKDEKVLVVKEKGGQRKGYYGIPGGRADRGELIAHCAQRQLFEETGIKAKFERVVFFRELTQKQIYGAVDIYFVCLMKLDQKSLEGFKLCSREISDHQWVPLEEFADFCAKNSVGTQILMSKQVTKLYHEKILFQNVHHESEINLAHKSCYHRL